MTLWREAKKGEIGTHGSHVLRTQRLIVKAGAEMGISRDSLSQPLYPKANHKRGRQGGSAMTKTIDSGSEVHLGQDALDAEHQGQVRLLLAVEKELCGANRTRAGVLLDELIEYSNIHFMSEQVLMREHAYPGLPAHEAEHDQLMDQIRDFQKRFELDEASLTAAGISTVRDWVLRHIRTKDTAFARYLSERA